MDSKTGTSGRTPLEDGFAFPAEWTPHRACYMAWPCRADTWKGRLEEARVAYSNVAHAIQRFEPVIMLVPPDAVEGAQRRLGKEIEVQATDLDDSWIRDNGPIFVTAGDGRTAAVKFRFNGWGERYPPFDKDATAPEVLAERLSLPLYRASIVAEGGALAVDGEGTLVTTESCLLNPNRNPGRTKTEVESELKSYLGIQKVIWLRQGMHASQIDGHVDGIAAFARPGVILAATAPEPSDPNHEIFRENREQLRSETDGRGRPIEVIDLPSPAHHHIEGHPLAATFMNFYIANGGIVAPIFGDPADARALDGLRSAFPGREVVGVRCEDIAIGGGDVHCITQQLPAAGKWTSLGR
ncbi:MAG: agmatine deiminase family protein [Thermoplasmata archaeon]